MSGNLPEVAMPIFSIQDHYAVMPTNFYNQCPLLPLINIVTSWDTGLVLSCSRWGPDVPYMNGTSLLAPPMGPEPIHPFPWQLVSVCGRQGCSQHWKRSPSRNSGLELSLGLRPKEFRRRCGWMICCCKHTSKTDWWNFIHIFLHSVSKNRHWCHH